MTTTQKPQRHKRQFRGTEHGKFGPNEVTLYEQMLREVREKNQRRHMRSREIAAITFRPTAGAGLRDDRVAAGWSDYDAFRAITLTPRCCRLGTGPHGRLVDRYPLTFFKPILDVELVTLPDGREVLLGSGRIRYKPEACFDLAFTSENRTWKAGGVHPLNTADNPVAARVGAQMFHWLEASTPAALATVLFPQFYWFFPQDTPVIPEPSATAEEWKSEMFMIEGLVGWPARFFTRDPHGVYSVNPVDGSPNPWDTGDAKAEDAIFGNWFLYNGNPIPLIQTPEMIATGLRSLGDRQIVNPAFEVLVRNGVIDGSFRNFLGSMYDVKDGIKTLVKPVWIDAPNGEQAPHNVAARFRTALIAIHDNDTPRFEMMVNQVVESCQAQGLTVSKMDAAEMLDTPWEPSTVEGAPPIQVLTIPEGSVPESWQISTPDSDIDLWNLAKGCDPAGFVDPRAGFNTRPNLLQRLRS